MFNLRMSVVRQTKKSVLAERRRPMIAEREKDCSFLKVYKGDESVRSVGRLCTENKRVTEIVARYIRVPPPTSKNENLQVNKLSRCAGMLQHTQSPH